MMFAYVAPETMLPVASVLAAVGGFFMMFGRGVIVTGRRFVRRVFTRSRPQ